MGISGRCFASAHTHHVASVPEGRCNDLSLFFHIGEKTMWTVRLRFLKILAWPHVSKQVTWPGFHMLILQRAQSRCGVRKHVHQPFPRQFTRNIRSSCSVAPTASSSGAFSVATPACNFKGDCNGLTLIVVIHARRQLLARAGAECVSPQLALRRYSSQYI